MSYSDLTSAERFVYEWQHGMLGSFSHHLAEAIARADGPNAARLSLAFPDEVDGIKFFQNTPGWWEMVEERAQADSPSRP